MTISVFDLFQIGIGPSSSHTVGPMKAALLFGHFLQDEGMAKDVERVQVELFGSLGATGHGHGTVKAVVLGLQGHAPETVNPVAADPYVHEVRETGRLTLPWGATIAFSVDDDVVLHRRKRLDFHTNGMQFAAYASDGNRLALRTYFSVGGGFILSTDDDGPAAVVADPTPVPYPFRTAEQLLAHAQETERPISWVMLQNELVRRSEEEVRAGLLHIWSVMKECIERGSRTEGTLPGGLRVRRRAAPLFEHLAAGADEGDPLRAMEWITLFALAVNEENAAGGRVVTAPTNGAAGIVPAVSL